MVLSRENQLRAGTLLSYAQTAVSVIISLVYTPAMLSLLGQSEYGLYNIAATTVSYVNLLNMGFSGSYVRFYSRDKAQNDENAIARTNGLFCLVFLVIGVLALIAGFVLTFAAELFFSDGLRPEEYPKLKAIMLILTVSTAYNLATSVFSSIIVAHERFVFHKSVNLLKTIFSPTVTWILLLWGYRSVMMALVTAILTIVVDTFYVVFCFGKLKIKVDMHNPSKQQLKEISVFSGFIALSSIVDQINWSVDKLLLGRMWGTAYTAVYSVASTIQTLYMQMSTAISNVFIPSVNRLVAEKRPDSEITSYFVKIGRMQTFVLLPILLGFAFLGRSFIRLWTPNGYEEAYIIALLLMIASTVPYIQNVGVSIQVAQNKHRFRSVLYACVAAVNLVVSILLCKQYGAIGCAIGTFFSLVIGNGIIMNIYYHKVVGINMKQFWKSMLRFLPAVIVLCVVGFLLMNFVVINSWLRLILSGAGFCLIYLVMLWFTAMQKEEKDQIKSFLAGFKNKRRRS